MNDPQQASRRFSERAVMEAVLASGPISRATLAKHTGLSKQTVSDIVSRLEEDRWLRETGRTHGHIGRTAVTYELDPDGAYVMAVDLGGTKLHVAIADLACELKAEERVPTDGRGGRHVIAQIARVGSDLATRAGIERDRIGLAVVGVPGSPDAGTGRVLLAPNIAEFDSMDVAGALRQALGTDVILENDVNLGAVGENWLGQGQGIDNLAYVALGTGTGSGLIAGGQMLRGHGNAAGELAFLPFGADPFDPDSLKMGAFERAAGSFGMVDAYAALSGERIEVRDLFARAGTGDPLAIRVLDDTGRTLARGIAAIAAIANPEKVILGGSIGLRPEIIERIRLFLPLCFPSPVTVEPGRLGGRASVLGAAALGISRLHAMRLGDERPARRLFLPAKPTAAAGCAHPA